MHCRGWTLVSATVDHGAKLYFCTRGSISVSAQPSSRMETCIDGSVGVPSFLLSRRPFNISVDSGSMVRRTPLM